MKITNHLKLPRPLVDAVSFDDYTRGDADFSVTQLSKPSLQLRLRRDYDQYLVDDAANRIWALFGTAVHNILERAASFQEADKDSFAESYTVETRRVGSFGPWKVSGKQDVYVPKEKKLVDYKVTSYHSVTDGPKIEWVQQLNALACIWRQHDIEIEKLQIVAILRDWSWTEAFITAKIPWKVPVCVLDIPVWDNTEAQRYIMERCASHEYALAAEDITKIPPCTPNECWEKPTRYAIMKRGNKRALRVFDTQEEADIFLVDYLNKPDSKKKIKDPRQYFLKTRPGARINCSRYCPVSQYCHAYKQWKIDNDLENDD